MAFDQLSCSKVRIMDPLCLFNPSLSVTQTQKHLPLLFCFVHLFVLQIKSSIIRKEPTKELKQTVNNTHVCSLIRHIWRPGRSHLLYNALASKSVMNKQVHATLSLTQFTHATGYSLFSPLFDHGVFCDDMHLDSNSLPPHLSHKT